MIKKLDKIIARYEDIEQQLADPAVVNVPSRYQALAKEYSELGPLVEKYRQYKKGQQELRDLEELLAGEKPETSFQELYEEEKQTIEQRLKELQTELEDFLLAEDDPYKDRDLFVEIRAGTGGEEAALFAGDLLRMYERYAATLGFRTEIMSLSDTGIGGVKEVIFTVSGKGAYQYLKYESGTHRVQRVPETEASGRIHTSAVTVAVLPEAEDVEVEISPTDLRIDTYRASGAGGQHVNKTESAIRITHVPTGLVVTCQDDKSQHKNKAKALRILRTRLIEKMQQEQQDKISKDRKQQVGSGDRSERIRTYNFPDKRVTDHRIGLTLHSLDQILEGELGELVSALQQREREKRLSQE